MQNCASNEEIQSPDNWGNIPSHYDDLVTNLTHLNQLNPISEETKHSLDEEFNQRESALDAYGPVVPGTMFIFPRKDLLSNENLNVWLPSIVRGQTFSDLCPNILPFNLKEYVASCDIVLQLESDQGMQAIQKLLDIAKIVDNVFMNQSDSPQAFLDQRQVDQLENNQPDSLDCDLKGNNSLPKNDNVAIE